MKNENKKKAKTAGLIVASAAVGTIIATNIISQDSEVDDVEVVYGPPAYFIQSDSLTDEGVDEELNNMLK